MCLLSAVSRRFQQNRSQLLSYGIHSLSSRIVERRARPVACLDIQWRDGTRPWATPPWRSGRFFTTSDDDSPIETMTAQSFDVQVNEQKLESRQQSNALDDPTENDIFNVLDDRLPSDNDSDSENDDKWGKTIQDDALESQMVAQDIVNVTKTSPLAALNLHYSNEYGRSSVRNCFITEQRELLWFATFICPETGIKYPHGTLRSFDQGPQELDIAATATCTTDSSTTVDVRVGYRKKNSAVHAAAARVLDIIHYTKLRVTEPRLCEEDPAAFYLESFANIASPKSTHTLERGMPSPQNTTGPMDDHDIGKQMENFAINSVEVALTDDEYIIAEIPSPSCEHEPSQRLLHAFSSGQFRVQKSTATIIDLNRQQRMPSSMGPLARLELAVNLAKSWTQANTRSNSSSLDDHLHRIQLPMSPSMRTEVVGMTLLENLAEANQMVAISPGYMGCEEVAWQILDVICKHTNACPDADAYNLLLRCLEGKRPMQIAQKAEAIVNAMQSGKNYKGRTLPGPNITTINILIQLWAQVGGTTGRYNNLSSDFVPNRESFLSLLSSCCYLPQVRGEKGGLDIEFAKDCIFRMQELSEAHPDDLSLVPDVHVYNAPLRWRGGLFARASRPYARPIPWDFFEDNSGKDELRAYDDQDSRVVWAQDVEIWIDFMRQQGILPDIESYEALMQAWLATGTRVGLERAQTIANNLLDGVYQDATPRLQTFRPLILRWLFSKSVDAEQMIEALLDKLDLIGESDRELRPDARLRMALVHAYRNQALAEKEQLSIETQVKRAEQCSSILDQLRMQLLSDIEDGEATEIFLETIYFVLAMDIWQLLARSCIKDQSGTDSCTSSYEKAIKEMHLLMDTYDELIQSLMKEESPDGVGLRLRREYSIQLKHLVVRSGALYSSFVLALRDLCQCHKDFEVGDDNFKRSLLNDNLLSMERIVRRSGEMKLAYNHENEIRLQRFESSDSSFDRVGGVLGSRAHDALASGPVQYDDFFTTVRLRRRNLDASEHSVLLGQILEYLSMVDLNSVNLGDYTRLLLLIKESIEAEPGAFGSISTTKPGALVDRLIEKVTRVTNNDSSFPFGSKHKTGRIEKKIRRRMPVGRYKRSRRTAVTG